MRLLRYLCLPVVTTTSLPAVIANVPPGIVPDASSNFGLMALLNNTDSIDSDMLAVAYGAATTLTLTPAQMTANYLDFSGSGVLTATTPTAAQIAAALPNTINPAGYGQEICMTNDGTGVTITIAGGTGVTVLGNATIANNTTRRFLLNVVLGTAVPLAPVATLLNIGTMAL